MYTEEYISSLQKRTGNDPALLERVVYAFGLLEAITKAGLPFCFKGGTSLMLLFDSPRRLSTDIDIVVNPGTDVDAFIQKAGEIFPFMAVEEHIRIGRNNIEKRHFRFRYHSPRTDRDVTILLDVLFEELRYSTTVEKPIKNPLLMTEGDDLLVQIPNANSILGDKLTAFAPHTTGVLIGFDKELEVIKQLYDCAALYDVMTDFAEVQETYQRIVQSEMAYRGIGGGVESILHDTIRGCLCVASRGMVDAADYVYYKDGISRIRNHIISGNFNGEIAGACASKVLHLVAELLIAQNMVEVSSVSDAPVNLLPEILKPKWFSYLRLVDPTAYACFEDAVTLLRNIAG